MYALNLDNDGRILSATYSEYAVEGMPLVESLPDGDITNYLWIDGAYKYDPVPVDPLTPAPTLESRVEALEQAFETSILSLDAAYTEGVNSL